MPHGIVVRKVDRQDIPELAEVLSLAFLDDPVVSWTMRQDNKRLEALIDLFTFCLIDDLKGGAVTATSDLKACAIWITPEIEDHSFPFSWLSMLPRYIRWAGISRVGRFISFLNACESKRPKEPHYYLDYLGVHPSHRGEGYGSMLLTHTLEYLDSEGSSAYLENSNPRNNSFYELYGFRTVNEIHLPSGPTLWCKWREPNLLEKD